MSYAFLQGIEPQISPGAYAFFEPGVEALRILTACIHSYQRFIESSLELRQLNEVLYLRSIKVGAETIAIDPALFLIGSNLITNTISIGLNPDHNRDC